MPKKDELKIMESLLHVKHQHVRWSNFLINAAIDCSLVEKRVLYFISLWVKRNFTEKELGVPEHWKDLYMHMTDEDLGMIGGRKNVPRTYKALCKLAGRVISVSYVNEQGEQVHSRFHWIDSFCYNEHTNEYDMRISPELLPYMIDVEKNFTTLDVGEAMTYQSKVTQRIYEFLSMYSGDYRYTDAELKASGYVYAKNVLPVDIKQLRQLFCLDEVRDNRTGSVLRRSKYGNFNSIRKNILEKVQEELYKHYLAGSGSIWFDFQLEEGSKRGRKVKRLLLYIYTKANPKRGELRPWREGDEPLSPYEKSFTPNEKPTPEQKIHSNAINTLDARSKEYVLAQLLKRYLLPEEVIYYLRMVELEKQRRKYNKTDVVMQMIQVIQDKEGQGRFSSGSDAYKRKNLINYVFTSNLKEDYGWSIPPMKKGTSGKRF